MTVYKMNDIFMRYEPDIDEGILFVFNKTNGEIFEGDYYTYAVLRLIDGKKDEECIVSEVLAEFELQDSEDTRDSVKNLLYSLVESNLIIVLD